MLKLVQYLDYGSSYAYAPSHAEAAINTEEIVSVREISPENTRSSYPIVRVKFKGGHWLDVIGKPSDFIEKESGNEQSH